VTHATSAVSGCPPSNVLLDNDRCLWLSEIGIPQSFTIDLTNLRERPKTLRCFGVKCWHSYSSNPAVIDLYVGGQDRDYEMLTSITMKQKTGTQYFPIPAQNYKGTFLKVVVMQTFGADKTYINQVFLLEDCPAAETAKPFPLIQIDPLENSGDLKRKLASQLKELDEGMKMYRDQMPPSLPIPILQMPKAAAPGKENCGHGEELERLRRQVTELNDKVKYLESQLQERSSPEARTEYNHHTLHRDTSHTTIKRAESRTANSTLLYSPTADFRSEFDRHIREWEARVLTPQLKETMHERKTPVPDILSKLQDKLHERSRKLEILESERSRRLKVSSSRRSSS